MANKTWKTSLACSAAVVALATATTAAAQQRTFNIPAENAIDSIPEFGRQAGVQITAPDDQLVGVQTPAIKGQRDARQALKELLAGTGLHVISDNGAVIVLHRGGGAANAPRDTSISTFTHPTQIEEVVVTGTHLRGVKDTTFPAQVFDRNSLADQGITTVEGLAAVLPGNFQDMTPGAFSASDGTSVMAQQNSDRASAFDLRGLGAQSTLTLLDGMRLGRSISGRVVDVSTIPLAAIERVEVVEGGYSAIYGSDAVAGVVNLVPRHDFDGIESQTSVGSPTNHGGGTQYQFSTVGGISRDLYGFLVGAEYTRDSSLNILTTGHYISPIPSNGATLERLDLSPESERKSVFLSGRFAPSPVLELTAEALYSSRIWSSQLITKYPGAVNDTFYDQSNNEQNYNISTKAKIHLPGDWNVNIGAYTSGSKIDERDNYAFDFGSFSFGGDLHFNSVSKTSSLSAVIDGKLPSVGSVQPSLAVGVETRSESLKIDFIPFSTVNDASRNISSVFAELRVPLIENGTTLLLRRLEISAAGRYDHYSDFGGTTNPQLGVIWGLTSDVSVRAAYASSFRAPDLVELGGNDGATLYSIPDAQSGSGFSPVLTWAGQNPSLGPERAKSWSATVDYTPSAWPGARFSLSYFDINYHDRLDVPALGSDLPFLLENAARYPGLITRNPSAGEVAAVLASLNGAPVDNQTGVSWNPSTQSLLSAFPNLILFDDRTNNIAVEHINGVDFSASATHNFMFGKVSIGVNGTYTLNHDRGVTADSPTFSALNEVGRPVGFRFRTNAGLERGPYGAFVYVNYTNSYTNPFTVPESSIGAWTTVDATIRFNGALMPEETVLSRVRAALVVSNLFNSPPPSFRGGLSALAYDAANSNPMGRYVSLQLTLKW